MKPWGRKIRVNVEEDKSRIIMTDLINSNINSVSTHPITDVKEKKTLKGVIRF